MHGDAMQGGEDFSDDSGSTHMLLHQWTTSGAPQVTPRAVREDAVVVVVVYWSRGWARPAGRPAVACALAAGLAACSTVLDSTGRLRCLQKGRSCSAER